MMNKKMKFSITVATIGALALSSVGAFAGTTGLSNAIKGHQGILDLMLKDGVVTQTQIDTYSKKVQEERSAEVTTAIQALVTKGTLTQAKADAVLKVVAAHEAERTALKEKLSSMSAEEQKAYLTANPVNRTDHLLALVEAGTLTAADVEALRGVIGFGGHDMGHGKGGHGRGGNMGFKAPTSTGTTTDTKNQ